MSNYVSGVIVYILAILTSPILASNGNSYVIALVSDNADKIYQYNMTDRGAELMSRTITDTNNRPYSIDYDPVEEKVYWERYKNYNLMKADLDGVNQVYVTDFDSRIVDIVIDWKKRLMFLSDDKNHRIKRMTMNNNTISTILDARPNNPSHLALDTTKRLIYWSDMGSDSRIEVATYEGSGRDTLISTGVRWPSGLTLDAKAEILFWCDAHSSKTKITSMNLETKRTTVIRTGKKYFDLSYFEGRLYVITRNDRSSFFSVSLDGSNETRYSLPKELSEWRRIRVFRYYTECSSGYYGVECSERCGHCANNTGCVKTTGACIGGCEASWTGTGCNTECENGTYGPNCNSPCGMCKDGAVCDKKTGECPNGCEPGWMEVKCDTECGNWTYGPDCNSTCGMCKDAVECHKKTGECLNGCGAGWQGIMCDTECGTGTYGSDCNSTCGMCKDAADCDKTTGRCVNGCEPGWMGELCDAECKNGTYGSGCISTCGMCKDAADCDNKIGECLKGCEPGWTGELCDTESKNLKVHWIIGFVCGLVCLIVLIAVVIAVLVKRQRKVRYGDGKTSVHENLIFNES